jgi:hypothetical protein
VASADVFASFAGLVLHQHIHCGLVKHNDFVHLHDWPHVWSHVQGMRQAETEFLLWQSASNYPFCQLITDLNAGGVAFFALPRARPGESARIMYQVLPDMQAVWDFMAELVTSLDVRALTDVLRSDQADMMPEHLEHPRRVKPRLEDALVGTSSSAVSFAERFWKKLSAMQADERDVGCVQDVSRFDDWLPTYPEHSPYHG